MVIDFEYAAANIPGQEFANHFTEWTYNYHDPKVPWACNVHRYPKMEEQRRFIKAYIDHRTQSHHANSTPRPALNPLTPLDGTGSSGSASSSQPPPIVTAGSSSSIADFMLDARVPPGGWSAAEKAHEEETENKVRGLLKETRMWRPANSAMWVAWGVVQAKVEGGDAQGEDVEGEAASDEFDYVSYAQDRALFFWGDVVQMGLVDPNELPESLRARLKTVEF